MNPGTHDYHWPAEWETHRYTLLTWPQRPELWSGRIDAVRKTYLEIIGALAEGESVRILVNDSQEHGAVRTLLLDNGIPCEPDGAVDLWIIPTDDVWIRDYGPLRILKKIDHTSKMLAYTFTGWGNKFRSDADNQAAEHIAARLGETFHKYSDFVIEGGAIETNGHDVLITTEACLLHSNRNPELKREEIEARLKSSLGVRAVLWLPNGLPGDDTDGHVDMITRFVAPDRVLTCLPDDTNHPAYSALSANLSQLINFRLPDGGALKIETLPLPPQRYFADNSPIPESYANFYIGNHVVLVPTFDHAETDRAALSVIQAAFANRRVLAISGSDLILEGGGIHCMTMQVVHQTT